MGSIRALFSGHQRSIPLLLWQGERYGHAGKQDWPLAQLSMRLCLMW